MKMALVRKRPMSFVGWDRTMTIGALGDRGWGTSHDYWLYRKVLHCLMCLEMDVNHLSPNILLSPLLSFSPSMWPCSHELVGTHYRWNRSVGMSMKEADFVLSSITPPRCSWRYVLVGQVKRIGQSYMIWSHLRRAACADSNSA